MVFYLYASKLCSMISPSTRTTERSKTKYSVLNFGLATYVTKLRYQPFSPRLTQNPSSIQYQYTTDLFLRFFDPENLYPKLNIKNRSSMATQITKRLISLLLALLLVSSTLASSDAPFIVAHKKATATRLKPGIERVSVSIDIYNQGSA